MHYQEKCNLFIKTLFKINIEKCLWKNAKDLEKDIIRIGGKIKNDLKRKKGHLVCCVHKSKNGQIIVEVPKDIAEKIIIFGAFP